MSLLQGGVGGFCMSAFLQAFTGTFYYWPILVYFLGSQYVLYHYLLIHRRMHCRPTIVIDDFNHAIK